MSAELLLCAPTVRHSNTRICPREGFGQGKFDSVHGLAIDPTNGDVWIGDREQYRIVIYSSDGKFLRTIQMGTLFALSILIPTATHGWRADKTASS